MLISKIVSVLSEELEAHIQQPNLVALALVSYPSDHTHMEEHFFL